MMQRDRSLGAALRAALTRPGEAEFVRHVLAQIEESGTWWEVLGRWVRPALAASLVLAAAAGFWLGQHLGSGTPMAFTDDLPAVQGAAGQVVSLFDGAQPPDIDVMLAVASGQD